MKCNLHYNANIVYFNSSVTYKKINHLKKILPLYIVLFTAHFGFSQNTKTLQGKVLFKENPLRDVEIISWNKKTITKSNAAGVFYIETEENDTLYFLSKNHLDKKIGIKTSDFQLDIFRVYLTEKTIDLEEITIVKNKSFGIKLSQAEIDGAKLQRNSSSIANKAVYMGTIENGIDFIRIFKGLVSIFKNKDNSKPIAKAEINFKKYVASNFNAEYFIKTLNLKPDTISKFIAFCNEDVDALKVVEHSNIFTVMDFLAKKNKDFKVMIGK